MEYIKKVSLDELVEIQRLSQTAYIEAFYDLLDKEDVSEYVKRKYCLEHLKEEILDKKNHFLLFYLDDKVAGYMKYFLNSYFLEIDRLYMLKGFKGMGIGSKLMNLAENIAKSENKKTLALGVLEINMPAISFYKKRGFVQYSRESVLIGKTNYPLLLMKKELR